MKNEAIKILFSSRAYRIFQKHMPQDVEELWCMTLGPSLNLLDIKMIFRGTIDACIAHPRDIFRYACVKNATQLIIAHNHPSGDPTPSKQDLEFTRKLIKVGIMIEIPVVDHLIVTKKNYFSLAESGLLDFGVHNSRGTEPSVASRTDFEFLNACDFDSK